MYTRLFQNHMVRREVPLDPIWDFHILSSSGEKQEEYKMLVPSCWENNPNLAS